MTMKEFKKYLENLIKDYEIKVNISEHTSRYWEYFQTLKELRDIRKVINS